MLQNLTNPKKRGVNPASEQVGQQLRLLRKARKLSIRALAKYSGLSVNTLSLIENGRTSPSVGTLEQLARSLGVPITAFFETERPNRKVVYQKAGERQQIVFSQGQMEKLSDGMPHVGSEPFITRYEPGANSGESPILFPGHEFVYCLEGQITYMIDGEAYPLTSGDSLIFDAHTPHSWRNTATESSSALLVLCPETPLDDLPERYFMLEEIDGCKPRR
ncbi:MAG: cupin domain-containing protein [Anaerolineales bacterium]|jgi:transcriptional regulator with XRE-family HTH domain|nr:cupin domain-containing protein [Anaerolineales bacterium]